MRQKHIKLQMDGKYGLQVTMMQQLASTGWAGRIFGAKGQNVDTGSFISPCGGDVIIIDLDYNMNKVTFTSQTNMITKCGPLPAHIKAVKFIVEINTDCSISFK